MNVGDKVWFKSDVNAADLHQIGIFPVGDEFLTDEHAVRAVGAHDNCEWVRIEEGWWIKQSMLEPISAL